MRIYIIHKEVYYIRVLRPNAKNAKTTTEITKTITETKTKTITKTITKTKNDNPNPNPAEGGNNLQD